MKRLFFILALLLIVSSSVFASFSLYLSGSYLWSYDTNVFSNPMVKYTTNSSWSTIREADPYIKRFNNGFSLNVDMFFSEEGRTGLSMAMHTGFAYKATEFTPNSDDISNSDWDYTASDVLANQKIAMFFSLGPIFRVELGDFDISLALRASVGSYDCFDNNAILGIQADPMVNYFFSDNAYATAGLHYDAHFVYLYTNSNDRIYLPDYLRLTAGAYFGIGYKFGGDRSTNV